MQQGLDSATAPWGVLVERVEVKDVRVPENLQRAMAAEAEAARNARAKVIAAEGEHKASRALRHAAEIISENPAALQVTHVLSLSPAPLPPNPVHHLRREQQHHHLPRPHRRAVRDDGKTQQTSLEAMKYSTMFNLIAILLFHQVFKLIGRYSCKYHEIGKLWTYGEIFTSARSDLASFLSLDSITVICPSRHRIPEV